MALPADYDSTKWLNPIAFQGLIGTALAKGLYDELFRESDGFAKPIADLLLIPQVADYVRDHTR